MRLKKWLKRYESSEEIKNMLWDDLWKYLIKSGFDSEINGTILKRYFQVETNENHPDNVKKPIYLHQTFVSKNTFIGKAKLINIEYQLEFIVHIDDKFHSMKTDLVDVLYIFDGNCSLKNKTIKNV